MPDPVIQVFKVQDQASAPVREVGKAAKDTAKDLERAEVAAKSFGERLDSVVRASGKQRALKDFAGDVASLGGILGGVPGMERFGLAVTAVGDASEAALSPLGAALLAIGGSVAVTVGAAAGMTALVRASESWVEALRARGALDGVVSSDDIAAIREANEAIDGLVVAMQQAGVVAASEMAPAVQSGFEILIGFAVQARDAMRDLEVSTDDVALAAGKVAGTLSRGALGGSPLGELIGTVIESRTRSGFAGAVSDAAATGAGFVAGLPGDTSAPDVQGPSIDLFLRDQDKLAREGAALMASRLAAAQQLEAVLASANSDTLDAAGKARAEYEAAVESVQAILTEFGGDSGVSAMAEAALAALGDRLQRDLVDAAHDALVAIGKDIEASARTVDQQIRKIIAEMTAVEREMLAVEREMLAGAAAKERQLAAGLDIGTSALTGNVGGLLAGAGPAGMIASAVLSLGPDFAEAFRENTGMVIDTIASLPENLDKLVAALIDMIPLLAAAIGEAIEGALLPSGDGKLNAQDAFNLAFPFLNPGATLGTVQDIGRAMTGNARTTGSGSGAMEGALRRAQREGRTGGGRIEVHNHAAVFDEAQIDGLVRALDRRLGPRKGNRSLHAGGTA